MGISDRAKTSIHYVFHVKRRVTLKKNVVILCHLYFSFTCSRHTFWLLLLWTESISSPSNTYRIDFLSRIYVWNWLVSFVEQDLRTLPGNIRSFLRLVFMGFVLLFVCCVCSLLFVFWSNNPKHCLTRYDHALIHYSKAWEDLYGYTLYLSGTSKRAFTITEVMFCIPLNLVWMYTQQD